MNSNRTTLQLSIKTDLNVEQQLETKKIKKKKCHGNRKKQRYRRQLYTKGLDSESVDKLVEEKFPSQNQQEEQIDNETLEESDNIQNLEVFIPLERFTLSPTKCRSTDTDSLYVIQKRKKFLLTPTPTTENLSILDQPTSQLFISQHESKRKKTTPPPPPPLTTTNNVPCNTEKNNKPSTNYMEQFKPRYLKVSDRIFRKILSNTTDNASHLVQCLNTSEKLHLIRHTTEIINNLCYKDLQRQLWQEYYNISTNNDQWQSKITKQYTNQHHTCRMYKPSKVYIEERRKTIEHQLKQIGKELHQNLINLQEHIASWKPSIDFHVLSHIINECVKNNQQRLKNEFNHKKQMIKLDWNDHLYLNKFYQLKPNEELIQLAKNIWQTTANELKMKDQQEILRQLISLKRLPTKIDQIVNQFVSDNEITLANPFLEQDQRASFVSRCSKTLIQCKFNLMLIELDELETIIRRHHLTFISLQENLWNLNKENPDICTNLLMDIIEERRQAMIERFYHLRQYKLETFFGQAPTMLDNSN